MNKVLIVDDAAFMRGNIKQMLSNNGYEVIGEAENGLEGVRKYKELSPDIVTMDITMPEMSGIQAVQEIRKINPRAKIIMVSAMGQQNFVLEAIKSGATGFVVKPFKEEQIMKAISKL